VELWALLCQADIEVRELECFSYFLLLLLLLALLVVLIEIELLKLGSEILLSFLLTSLILLRLHLLLLLLLLDLHLLEQLLLELDVLRERRLRVLAAGPFDRSLLVFIVQRGSTAERCGRLPLLVLGGNTSRDQGLAQSSELSLWKT